MKGRKSLSVNDKRARGTLQNCRIKDTVDTALEPVVNLPPAPEWFGDMARQLYTDAAREFQPLGIINALSLPLFTVWCDVTARYFESRMEGHSMYQMEAGGNRPSAEFKVEMALLEQSRKLAAEFGLTPVAQTRILNGIIGRSPGKKNDIEKLFT